MRKLSTERLLLRRIREDDAEAIFYGWANDSDVTKYLTWNPHTSPDDTRALLKNIWLPEYDNDTTYRWGIELKSDGTLIGMIDVVRYEDGCPVIGYCSGKKFWGNGYMTEAARAVIAELFECGFTTILIYAAEENTGSNRVIEKSGFTLTHKEKHAVSEVKSDVILTINYYRLDKTEE